MQKCLAVSIALFGAFFLGATFSSHRIHDGPYSQIRFCPTGSPELDDQLARAFVVRYLLDRSEHYAEEELDIPVIDVLSEESVLLPSQLISIPGDTEFLNGESWTYEIKEKSEKVSISLRVVENCSYSVSED